MRDYRKDAKTGSCFLRGSSRSVAPIRSRGVCSRRRAGLARISTDHGIPGARDVPNGFAS